MNLNFLKDEKERKNIKKLLKTYDELQTLQFKHKMSEAIIRYVKEIDKATFIGCKGKNINILRTQLQNDLEFYNNTVNGDKVKIFNSDHEKALKVFFDLKKYNIANMEILETYLSKEKYLYIDNFIHHYMIDNNLENNEEYRYMTRRLLNGRFDKIVDSINYKFERED